MKLVDWLISDFDVCLFCFVCFVLFCFVLFCFVLFVFVCVCLFVQELLFVCSPEQL